ncbi:hypothetical protein JCM8547_001036 [Rhodosporidiobolus lusitaniae]
MDAAMRVIQQDQQLSPSSSRFSRPRSNGDRPGFAFPAPHPYAASATPSSPTVPTTQHSSTTPPLPQPHPETDSSTALGTLMMTSDGEQSLPYLSFPQGPLSPAPVAPHISPCVPRFHLSDGPSPASLPLSHGMAHPQPQPVAPFSQPPPVPPLPLPATPPPGLAAAPQSDLSRKPSLTVSSQAANTALPASPPGSQGPNLTQYRAHDSPMPFRSLTTSSGTQSGAAVAAKAGAAYAMYPRPPGSSGSGSTMPPPLSRTGSLSPLPSIDVVPAHGGGGGGGMNAADEKIWLDEQREYRNMEAEDDARKTKKVKKQMALGLIALLVIAAIAIAVGVTVSKHKEDNSSKSQLAAGTSAATSSSSAPHSAATFLSHSATKEDETTSVTSTSASTARAVSTSSSSTSEATSSSLVSSSVSSSSASSTESTSITSSSTRLATSVRSTASSTSSVVLVTSATSTPTSGQVITSNVEDMDTSATAAATTASRSSGGRGGSSGGEDDDADDDDHDEDDEDSRLDSASCCMDALLTFDQLESWRRADNPLIQRGYRRLTNSYLACCRSIGSLHNETVNIWTHLLGSTAALFVLAYLFLDLNPAESLTHGRKGLYAPLAGIPYPFPSAAQPSVRWSDTVGFAAFLFSAATCLGLSASFHTFLAHSEKVAIRWNRLDYIGIVVLISGTFVPLVHYGFFCDPHLRNFYISLIYTFSAVTIGTVIAPHARTPEYRRFRTFLFIVLGASAVFPIGHAVLRYGLEGASAAVSLPWVVLGGLLYIVGALLYAERYPERFRPGRFCFFGSSHQIFHVLILLAAVAHWCGIAEAFRYWHGERQGVCPALDLQT